MKSLHALAAVALAYFTDASAPSIFATWFMADVMGLAIVTPPTLMLLRAGLDSQSLLAILNPGGNNPAKRWPADRFAAVAAHLGAAGLRVLINGSPGEADLAAQITQLSGGRAISLPALGVTLGSLLGVLATGRARIMVTNDTGPRHIAAAFGVPVVTIFGPTHMEWTEIYFSKERKVSIPVFCGPCQKKTCPLDHRCMTRVTPAMVHDAAVQLLGKTPRIATPA